MAVILLSGLLFLNGNSTITADGTEANAGHFINKGILNDKVVNNAYGYTDTETDNNARDIDVEGHILYTPRI